MSQDANRKAIAVVGTGLIGSSWTTLFLAKGHEVIVSDPTPGAKEKLDQFIKSEWPRMEKVGIVEGAYPQAYGFVDDILDHLEGVDFVQENSPERPEFMTKLIGNLDSLLPKGTIIASSSSGIPSSQFIGDCKNDTSRVLIGHPFNPPHLMPLVEVVPHPDTTSDAVSRAMDFCKSLGKSPVFVKKETPGFLADRLHLSEAYSLASRGIISAEDVDTAMSTGLGLRWALAGPYMINVLGGGSAQDPFEHFIEHLSPAVARWKKDMDEHSFSWEEKDVKALAEAVKLFVQKSDTEGVKRDMGNGLIELLELKKEKENLVKF